MAFSHLKVAAPKLTVFVALPITRLVIFLIDRSATKTLQECHVVFYAQHGIVSCTYPNEFILAVARDVWVCT